ncbi:unnamed protein product, partial [Didymodactylos carnosus]
HLRKDLQKRLGLPRAFWKAFIPKQKFFNRITKFDGQRRLNRIMGRGADRKRKWRVNKRLQGWSWREIMHASSRHGYLCSNSNCLSKVITSNRSNEQMLTVKDKVIQEQAQTNDDIVKIDDMLQNQSKAKFRDEKTETSTSDDESEQEYQNKKVFIIKRKPLLDGAKRLENILQQLDDRKRRLAVRRENSHKFREKLMKKYNRQCVVTGETIALVLDAAHIRSYNGKYCNDASNGLILRTDIHKLFDNDLLKLVPNQFGTVVVEADCLLKSSSIYKALNGKILTSINDPLTITLLRAHYSDELP